MEIKRCIYYCELYDIGLVYSVRSVIREPCPVAKALGKILVIQSHVFIRLLVLYGG